MKNELKVVKIGGTIIEDEKKLGDFLDNFVQLKRPKILVHGGGKLATKLSMKLGFESKMVNGRRVTSQKDLEVAVMVYAGLVNKKISAMLQGRGCNAIGLSGADANCIFSKKRLPDPVNFGYVGDIKKIAGSTLQLFLEHQLTPVFCAITHDGQGQLLNTNADTIATELAIAMSQFYSTQLIYCFEKKGVLTNTNDENSVIDVINFSRYQQLKNDGSIYEGMLPKLENSFHALHKNVSKVIIGDINAINNSKERGTTVVLI